MYNIEQNNTKSEKKTSRTHKNTRIKTNGNKSVIKIEMTEKTEARFKLYRPDSSCADTKILLDRASALTYGR